MNIALEENQKNVNVDNCNQTSKLNFAKYLSLSNVNYYQQKLMLIKIYIK